MITAEVKLYDHFTQVSGNTIEEKIKNFHTMTEFEHEVFSRKGMLQEELDSGWWYITK